MSMTHRDLLAMRERRRELEAEEAREREIRERPVKQAEIALQTTYRKLASVYRDRMLGKTPDPDIYISDDVAGLRLTDEHTHEFNRRQCVRFREEYTDLSLSKEVVDLLGPYWERNGVTLVTADMIAAAVRRLLELGLVQKPAPPKPVPAPAPVPAKQQTTPRPDDVFLGRDPDTGRERTYTRREVDRMSADEYKRRFKVLPTFRDVFESVERI